MNVPILSSKFFEKFTPDLGFFTKWRDLYNWNDQLMPIYEWQGILYVGCASLPGTQPSTQQKIVFLLCDPEELKRVWYNFEGTVVVSRSKSVPASTNLKPQIPEPSFHAEPVIKFNLEETPLMQSLDASIADTPAVGPDKFAVAKHKPEPTLAAPEELELPELTLSYQSPNSIDLTGSYVDSLDSATSVQEIRPAKVAPENPNTPAITEEQASEAISESTMEIQLDSIRDNIAAIEIQPPSTAAAAETQQPKVTPSASPQSVSLDPMEALMAEHGQGAAQSVAQFSETTEEETDHPKAEVASEGLELLDLGGAIVPPSLQATVSSEGSIKLEPLAAAETPAAATTEAAAPQTTILTTTAASSVDQKTNSEARDKQSVGKTQLKSPPLETWAEKALSEVKLEFEKVMILLRTGDQVKPWRWDEDFKSNSATLATYSLIPASPFRIVNRTHKSYHGYVVSNEANQKFFAQWNNNEVPEHMTIAPIVKQDVVIGMLLAIGKKTADTKGCLQLVEDKAAALAQHLIASQNAA